MGKLYQFTIHTTQFTRFRTYHTFEVEEPLTPAQLSRYASHLVSGQMFCSAAEIGVSHVVALECEIGELFDEKTITHTMLISEPALQNLGNSSVQGRRAFGGMGVFWCANIKRNKVEGRCRIEKQFGVVDRLDLAANVGQFSHNERIALNMDGTLALICSGYYFLCLEDLEGNDTLFRCDRFGNLSYEQENVSLRILSGVSKHTRQATMWSRRALEASWCDEATNQMQFWIRCCLEEYYTAMNNFDFDWYGNKRPDLDACIRNGLFATQWFYYFAKALRYNINPRFDGTFSDYPDSSYVGPLDPELQLRVQNVNDEILRCFNVLSQCWQFLRSRYYKVYSNIPGYDGSYTVDNTGGNSYPSTEGTLYDDFDNITATIFKANDCINVLSQILLPLNPRTPAPKRGKRGTSNQIRKPQIYDDVPRDYAYVHFVNVYPHSRGPVNWPLPSNEVEVYLPPQPIANPRTSQPIPQDDPVWTTPAGRNVGQRAWDFLIDVATVEEEYRLQGVRFFDRNEGFFNPLDPYFLQARPD